MNDSERAAMTETIDLTIANAALILELRRMVKALYATSKYLNPDFEKQFRTHYLEADERGEELHATVLAVSQRLKAQKDSLHNTDKGAK
jgi:hypothetical protein